MGQSRIVTFDPFTWHYRAGIGKLFVEKRQIVTVYVRRPWGFWCSCQLCCFIAKAATGHTWARAGAGGRKNLIYSNPRWVRIGRRWSVPEQTTGLESRVVARSQILNARLKNWELVDVLFSETVIVMSLLKVLNTRTFTFGTRFSFLQDFCMFTLQDVCIASSKLWLLGLDVLHENGKEWMKPDLGHSQKFVVFWVLTTKSPSSWTKKSDYGKQERMKG